MQYVLSLLPLFACPAGMGLMMWFMMRGRKEQPAPHEDRLPIHDTDETDTGKALYPSAKDTDSVSSGSGSSSKSSIFSMLFMCLNWKVVAGLAVVAVIIGIIAPQLLLGAIPLLIVAACPLSMLFMMRGMHRGQSPQVQQPSLYTKQENSSALEGPADEERVAFLKAQLAQTEAHQQELARQIADLEVPKAVTLSETEPTPSRNRK